MIQLFAVYLKTRYYHKISGDESKLFKQIIQDDSVSLCFVQSLDQNRGLWYYLKNIEPEYIDYDLICAIENILVQLYKDNYNVDRCLLSLLSKVRHDEDKQLSLSKYLARYSDVFKRLDKSEGEKTLLIMTKSWKKPTIILWIRILNRKTSIITLSFCVRTLII